MALTATPFLFDTQSAYDDTLKFLAALGGFETRDEALQAHFCFQVFPDAKKESLSDGVVHALPMHRTGTIQSNISWLRRSNEMSSGGLSGVYVVVNETDGKGRKAANVVGVRALFVELDHGGLEKIHMSEFADVFGASMVVESSPGKCHVYWLLESGVCPLEKFSAVQSLLIERFKALKSGIQSKDLSRVLRLPGFIHLKDLSAPWLVRLHYCDGTRRYGSVDEVFSAVKIDATFIEKFKARKVAGGETGGDRPAVVAGERKEFIGFEKGNRNEAMYTYVFSLMRVKGLNRDEALGTAIVANSQNKPPLDRSELEQIVGSAWKKFLASEQKSKFDEVQELLAEATEADGGEEESGIVADGVENFNEKHFPYNYHKVAFISPVSDASLVERLVQKYPDRLKSNTSTGLYFYEDSIWKNNPAHHAGETAFLPYFHCTMQQMAYEQVLDNYFVTPKGNPDLRAFRSFMKESFSQRKFKTLMEGLEYRQEIFADFRQFDSRVGFIPVQNGILNISLGKLVPDAKEYYFTKRAEIAFNPEAKCRAFEQFISDIMVQDGEMIAYLQKVCGLLLAGDTSNQCLYLLYGTGGNGKSKFLKIMNMILGQFYGELSADTLIKGHGHMSPSIQSGLAQAYGKRLISVAEVEEGSEWNESLVKSLSGDDTIVAKYFHKDPFEYFPTYSMMVRANHKPIVRGGDEGIWDRFRMIPFLARFRGTEGDDRHIEEKMVPELSGILNWMVQGYQSFLSHGLNEPEKAMIMKREYRIKMNPWKQFVDEFTMPCQVEIGLSTTEFVEIYNKWASSTGAPRIALNVCGDKLDQLGIPSGRPSVSGVPRRVRYGIKLKLGAEDILNKLKPDNLFQLEI